MTPIQNDNFSDDYQKFVLQKQPVVNGIYSDNPDVKKFSLDRASELKKSEGKDKKKKDEDEEEEDAEGEGKHQSPWIPRPPKKK